MIDSKQGYSLPLSQLADITVEEGPVQISRENAQRRMAIELNVQGRDIGGFVADAQKQIKEKVPFPAGTISNGAASLKIRKQAMQRLSIITPVSHFG